MEYNYHLTAEEAGILEAVLEIVINDENFIHEFTKGKLRAVLAKIEATKPELISK